VVHLIIEPGTLIILLNCASAKFIQTGQIYEPWDGVVQILEEPPRNERFTEIGWVTGKMSGQLSDWGKIIEKMQETARKKGANAIILIDKDASMQGSVTANAQYGILTGSTYQEKNLTAKAIRIMGGTSSSYNAMNNTPSESQDIQDFLDVAADRPKIQKIQNNLVLFEDSNAYKIGERLNVFRGSTKIGVIEVAKYQGYKIIGKIISQTGGGIKVGDEIR